MKEVPLTKGKVALVDDEDYERVMQYKWHATVTRMRWYARRAVKSNSKWGHLPLHRFILGLTDDSVQVDHRNNDGLDNRRCNLRIASKRQNRANQGALKGRPFKGIVLISQRTYKDGGQRWLAELNHRRFGTFKTPEEAARAYDKAALKEYGEFARLNFPEG